MGFDLNAGNGSWIPGSVAFSGFAPSIGASAPSAAQIQSFSNNAQSAALAPPAVAPVGAAASTGFGAGTSVGTGLGFNVGTGQLILGGLQTIGSLWNAMEARKLAEKQFAFQKEITEANLKNQIKAYNTTLEDRGRSRAFTEGQDSATAQAYIDNNRLSR